MAPARPPGSACVHAQRCEGSRGPHYHEPEPHDDRLGELELQRYQQQQQ